MAVSKETRIVFGVKDIVAARVYCRICKGTVLRKLYDTWPIPDNCPLCGELWIENGQDFPARDLLRELRHLLDKMAETEGLRAQVNFELDGDSDSAAGP